MSCCNKCKKSSCDCERPNTMVLIRSVEFIIDPTSNQMYVSVNGVDSNKVPYMSGGGGGGTGSEITFDIPISTDNETLFSQVIPPNATLKDLFINGIKYEEDVDFEVTGANNQDILWVSDKFPLEITDTLTITVIVNI